MTVTSTRAERAGWLRSVADRLDDNAAALVEVADSETHLGAVRLTGEVARTTGQLRLFADVLLEGSYLEAVLDEARPDATPPQPEIRRVLRPVGPVAVFSASNFPFAFSVAGGDTASALAAGCPVTVKAHSGHLELSRRTAEIVTSALADAGAPAGLFALVEGREAGLELVTAPATRAVSFTGSLSGGRALIDAIATRDDPIPFYGELGSINPVVITPASVAARGDELAAGLVASFTLGAGQFCTKPGVVFVPRGFAQATSLAERVDSLARPTLLTERITAAFGETLEGLLSVEGVELVAAGAPGGVVGEVAGGVPGPASAQGDAPAPTVLQASIGTFAEHSDALLEECFGPLTLLVEYDSLDEVEAAIDAVAGSLTATVHAESGDDIRSLVERLAELAGRVLFDGWPTGVAVTWGQHHGGPWPATNTQHTSVGATAIRRFLRPIAYQNSPVAILPEDLTDAGLARIPHRRNGELILP
jgi:NADP-dependent aldehyde dehydrogenase